MFEVLVFVYENYWRGDVCPQWNQLERKLNAVGFEAQEIQEALAWLNGLSQATRDTRHVHGAKPAPDDQDSSVQQADRQAIANSGTSMRVFSVNEQNRLGPECLGFIRFLESAAVLAPHMREIVVDRAMACGSDPLPLDDFKIIVLMVYWSFGEEPDALVLDELCDDAQGRIAH
jgi:Smg protein